jgi:hypothetical protein
MKLLLIIHDKHNSALFYFCWPLFENAGTRPVQTQHKSNVHIFMGKETLQKIIRTTIWGVQLKSGDN